MAFELSIVCKKPIPSNLRELWAQQLKDHNISCEISPNFSPQSWNGGFLPFRVDEIPQKLIGTMLQARAISGFEVEFDDNMVFFRSTMGRTTTEFALLCLCAAELTKITDGEYHNNQSGEIHNSNTVLESALKEIEETLNFEGTASRDQHPFNGWNNDEENSFDLIENDHRVKAVLKDTKPTLLKKPWWKFWYRSGYNRSVRDG